MSQPATGRGGHRGVLFAMCLSLVLVVASVSALNLALPELAVDLGASTTDLTWIADAYTVALAALVLPIGALGDRWGRRDVLLVGTVVFGAASFAAATADSAGALIGWRIAMGVGAAMIMPGTLSTITAAFPEEQRARGVSTWAGFAAAGAIIGLLVAGALLEQWGWQSIFLASGVVAIVAGASAALLTPNTRDEEPGQPDLAGAVLTALAIGALVYGIIEGSEVGWTAPIVLGAFALAAAALVGYAVLGLRHDDPLLDPRLFGRQGFRSGSLTILVQFMAVFGFFFVGLQYLQLILEYSPFKSAVALIPVALVVLPTSQATPRLAERFGLRAVMTGGLLAMAAGMAWISTLEVDSGYRPFLAGLLVAGLGIGLTSSTGTAAIIGSLSARQQGVASAMNDTTREVGSAVGIAVMGSAFGSTYSDSLPGTFTQLPAAARVAVQDSPAGGLEVAAQLGGAQGAQLAEVVRSAFIDGLSSSLEVIAVILAVAALGTAARAPRKQRTTDRPGPAEAPSTRKPGPSHRREQV